MNAPRMIAAALLTALALSGAEGLTQDAKPSTEGAPPLGPNAVRVNLREAGAKGDGVTDDSAAIQAAITKAAENTVLYFPAGTYLLHSLEISGKSGLEFAGDGHSSVLQWTGTGLPNGYTAMMTFTRVKNLLIHKIAFDNRNINNFGGLRFYEMKNVTIRNTRFFDSMRRETITNDRYSYCFGQGGDPHENILFEDNLIQDLEVEIDHARRVRVRKNTFERGVWLCFNWSSHGPNTLLEDYEVVGNKFFEPAGYAMTFHSEFDAAHRVSGLRIADNKIYMDSYKRSAINVGIRKAKDDKASVWEKITIENNHIEYTQGYTVDYVNCINVSRTPGHGPLKDVVIRNNTVIGNNSLATWAITANCLRNSTITGNTITGVLHGISVADELQGNTISRNSVEATGVAYSFERSLGGNKVSGNVVAGNPKTPWVQTSVHPTDSIDVGK